MAFKVYFRSTPNASSDADASAAAADANVIHLIENASDKHKHPFNLENPSYLLAY